MTAYHIFQLLCGILGAVCILLFGWSYKEASVYICIWFWPVVATATTLPLIYAGIKRIATGQKAWLGYAILPVALAYTFSYVYFYQKVLEFYHVGIQGTKAIFSQCVGDFQWIADQCGTTYETANLIIYVELMLVICLVNFALYWLLRPTGGKWFFQTAVYQKAKPALKIAGTVLAVVIVLRLGQQALHYYNMYQTHPGMEQFIQAAQNELMR